MSSPHRPSWILPIIGLGTLGLLFLASRSKVRTVVRRGITQTLAALRSPLPGQPRITSPFGPRTNPVTGEKDSKHTGIDLSAATGTPVTSPVAGKVLRVDQDGIDRGVINGNAVHVSGPEGRVWSFLHLSAVSVAPGDLVTAGQRLGLVGMTGRANGPHLHLQIAEGGTAIDPVPLFPSGTFA